MRTSYIWTFVIGQYGFCNSDRLITTLVFLLLQLGNQCIAISLYFASVQVWLFLHMHYDQPRPALLTANQHLIFAKVV